MQKMQMGGGFNIATKPSPADVSKNYSEFLSWWSPGQYLVPYFFKSILGINTGKAAAITTLLYSLSGLIGLYAFFKKVGFTPLLSAVSIAIIASQHAFVVPYVFYNGGEVLLFGFAGWFLYGCVSIDKTGWQLTLFLLLSGWMGFFCKSSFLWVYGAGCLYLWLQLSTGQKNFWVWIKNGIWIAIPAILSLAAIYKFYLSKGANPASNSLGIKLSWETFSFPLASPLLAGFSIDDIFNGLLFHNNATVLNATASLILLLLTALLSVILVVYIARIVPGKKYTLLLIVFYAVSVLFFGYSFLRQADISYEARHFRLIGLLITPGVVYLASRWKRPYKVALAIACLIIAFFSFLYFVPSYHQNRTVNAHGTSGLAQMFADQQSLNHIMDLDKKNTKAIFVFISPDLGLEINHNRYIILDASEYNDPELNTDGYSYWGHAGPLYIMLPVSYIGSKFNTIRKCFPGYKKFSAQMLSKKYVLYSAQ
jgi:hypothetical protein